MSEYLDSTTDPTLQPMRDLERARKDMEDKTKAATTAASDARAAKRAFEDASARLYIASNEKKTGQRLSKIARDF